MLLAIDRDVRADDAERLTSWRTYILSVTMRFEHLPTQEAIFARHVTLRENAVAQYHAIAHTTLQKIYMIVRFKEKMEAERGPQSALSLAKWFDDNVQQCSTSDRITKSFIDNALTISERVLTIPEVMQIITASDADKGHKSPWNSITRIHRMLTKARTQSNIIWAFQCINDGSLSGELDDADLAVSKLVGDGCPANRGLLDLIAFKREMRNYFFGSYMDKFPFPEDAKRGIRNVLANHANWRSQLKPFEGKKETTKLDLTWQSTWPKSAIMLLNLIEGIVYKTTFDCSLRTAVRAQKSCEECLEYQAFAEKVSDMEEQLESENNDASPTRLQNAEEGDAEIVEGDESREPACSDAQKAAELLPWREHAQRILSRNCKFLVEDTATRTQLAGHIHESHIGHTLGVHNKEYVAILADPALSGETITSRVADQESAGRCA